ncbi:MAG: glycosyltransferase family 2 protein [Anaerovibrio sp.]|nr:glycosyltransferase family 2 protein [Anaerovibrio sp.]
MSDLAVIILTKNEEANIEDCIKSAMFANEIIVIDSGSTDTTREKAETLGVKFVEHPMDDDGFAGQRNFALTQTKAKWVFYLDADERLTQEAADEIREIVQSDRFDAYRIKRMNVLFGKLMKYGAHAPDWCVRLYPRDGVHWVGVVHERGETSLPLQDLNGVMHHHTYNEWNSYFRKLGQYTDMMAERMHQDGKKAGLGDLTLRPAYAFIRAYFIKRGFLDGELGLVFSILHGYYTFLKYLKLRYFYLGKGEQH